MQIEVPTVVVEPSEPFMEVDAFEESMVEPTEIDVGSSDWTPPT